MHKALILLLLFLTLLIASTAQAHFGFILPSDDIVTLTDDKIVSLSLRFFHPFEGTMLTLEKPAAFSVRNAGQTTDLLPELKQEAIQQKLAWKLEYRIKRPGDHIFSMEPQPFWEPAERQFIIHYTKVVVSALGMSTGWDVPLGTQMEILPLCRPYALWSGNVFQGRVLYKGQPLPGAEVEVEYYNEGGKVVPPAAAYITQTIYADDNGVFTYAMPREGWWGFAALHEADYRLKDSGEEYPVELGGVIWVRTRDMK